MHSLLTKMDTLITTTHGRTYTLLSIPGALQLPSPKHSPPTTPKRNHYPDFMLINFLLFFIVLLSKCTSPNTRVSIACSHFSVSFSCHLVDSFAPSFLFYLIAINLLKKPGHLFCTVCLTSVLLVASPRCSSTSVFGLCISCKLVVESRGLTIFRFDCLEEDMFLGVVFFIKSLILFLSWKQPLTYPSLITG